MIMERGGRRRSRAADDCVPGHTVKNRMTVIARWGAIERKREFLKFMGRRESGALCFLLHKFIRAPAGQGVCLHTELTGQEHGRSARL